MLQRLSPCAHFHLFLFFIFNKYTVTLITRLYDRNVIFAAKWISLAQLEALNLLSLFNDIIFMCMYACMFVIMLRVRARVMGAMTDILWFHRFQACHFVVHEVHCSREQ